MVLSFVLKHSLTQSWIECLINIQHMTACLRHLLLQNLRITKLVFLIFSYDVNLRPNSNNELSLRVSILTDGREVESESNQFFCLQM